jgi:molybdopterin-guanine dinucleotide biosynthesis protein A
VIEAGRGTGGEDRAAQRVSGLVLCGGASVRMGRDKARLSLGDATLLERAIAILRAVTDDVRLACGPTERYAEHGLPLSLDRFDKGGPLAGLERGLADAPEGLVAVLAVDMPCVEPRLLAALIERAREGDLDVALLCSDTGLEPLCSVWSTRMSAAAKRALSSSRHRIVAAFEERLDDGSLPRVAAFQADELLPACNADVARNVNTPEDLESLRARGVA